MHGTQFYFILFPYHHSIFKYRVFPVLKKIPVSLPILQNKDVYENTNQHLAQHQQGPDIAFKGLALNYTSILEVKVVSNEF